jgi:hypothetical protein
MRGMVHTFLKMSPLKRAQEEAMAIVD